MFKIRDIKIRDISISIYRLSCQESVIYPPYGWVHVESPPFPLFWNHATSEFLAAIDFQDLFIRRRTYEYLEEVFNSQCDLFLHFPKNVVRKSPIGYYTTDLGPNYGVFISQEHFDTYYAKVKVLEIHEA